MFEFGVAREFEGVLHETPLPFLHVAGSDDKGGQAAATNLLLVGFGKHGLPPFARGHHGERVAFTGSLIYRADMTMVEMNDPESFRVIGPAGPGDALGKRELIGDVEIVGELVDTKCYLGVMRPATGKVHRACAVRCLEGGVPPGLLVRDASGGAAVLMLVDPEGQAPSLDPQWAARWVHARGTLELHDGLPVLQLSGAELVIPAP